MFSEGRYSRDFPGPLSARVLSAAAPRAGRWLCVTSGSRSCVPKADALLLASLFALVTSVPTSRESRRSFSTLGRIPLLAGAEEGAAPRGEPPQAAGLGPTSQPRR